MEKFEAREVNLEFWEIGRLTIYDETGFYCYEQFGWPQSALDMPEVDKFKHYMSLK